MAKIEKVRKDINFSQLNDKKLTELLKQAGLPKTGYKVLVFDINDNLIGAVKRSGSIYFFNDEEAQKVTELVNDLKK